MSKTRQAQIRTLSARFSPGHMIDFHSHSWSQLVYASEGLFTVETQATCWIVPTNRGIWIPSGQEHSVKMHGQVFLQTLYFPPETATFQDLSCASYEISGLMHELIRHVCRIGIVNGDSDENRNLIEFFGFQLRRLSAVPLLVPMPRDGRARQLARKVIDDPGSAISLHELSQGCGASLRTMQSLFADELGIPLARWRNQVKMIHAVQLLAADRSITDIAFELGFESVSGFIYSFRQHFGDAPGQFRSRHQLFNQMPTDKT